MTNVHLIDGKLTVDANDMASSLWTRYSLQNLVALYAPHMAMAGALSHFPCYLYDPTMKGLLYSALPTHCQTPARFSVCLLAEAHYMVYVVSVASPVFQLHIVICDAITQGLKMLTQSANRRYKTS